MEKYCTSLGLSKELYDKGIMKDAEFWWYESITKVRREKQNYTTSGEPIVMARDTVTTRNYISTRKDFKKEKELLSNYSFQVKDRELCPAPIAEELLSIMPEELIIDDCSESYTVVKEDNIYLVTYGDDTRDFLEQTQDLKLSDACAKMLLWLHKEGYLNE